MIEKILIAQLLAARAQIDATLTVLVGDECQHQSEEDLSTFGSEPKYRCNQCGTEQNKPFNTVEE